MNACKFDIQSLVDFRVRSKLFLGLNETSLAAQEDFEKRLEFLYPADETYALNFIQVTNPSFGEATLQDQQDLAYCEWEESCCSAIFFSEDDEGNDNIETQENIEMPSGYEVPLVEWMFKYELHMCKDAIEYTRNGEYVFSPKDIPHMSMTSSYH